MTRHECLLFEEFGLKEFYDFRRLFFLCFVLIVISYVHGVIFIHIYIIYVYYCLDTVKNQFNALVKYV